MGASNGAVQQPYNTLTFVKPNILTAGSSGTWVTANSPITMFTVTGLVLVRLIGVVTTDITSTGGTGTLQMRLGNLNYMGPATANGSNFALGYVWQDASPNQYAIQLANTGNWFLFNGQPSTINLAIATNNMTAGGMTMICQWISLGGTVTAATP